MKRPRASAITEHPNGVGAGFEEAERKRLEKVRNDGWVLLSELLDEEAMAAFEVAARLLPRVVIQHTEDAFTIETLVSDYAKAELERRLTWGYWGRLDVRFVDLAGRTLPAVRLFRNVRGPSYTVEQLVALRALLDLKS